jgi:phosphoesterase RecJ-like protein
MIDSISAIADLLKSPQKIVITSHHKPDADALGSSLALYRFLKNRGQETSVIMPSDYPKFLNWMNGNDEVIIATDENIGLVKNIIDQASIVFCLDFNALNRINILCDLVKNTTAVKVMIDHHLEPDNFAKYQMWDTQAAATAVLIYRLIRAIGQGDEIDTCISECLYAGVMTDTGSFKHPNTNIEVHTMVADLMSKGINASKIHKFIFDTNSEDKLRFLGFALSEKLKVIKELHTAYFVISKAELELYHSQTGDTEGLVNYALSLEGIVMACLIIERSDAVKMSFRSKENFSVNQFARNHFEGGGHKNAAGGKSDLSLLATEAKFLEVLPQYKLELINNNLIEKSTCTNQLSN